MNLNDAQKEILKKTPQGMIAKAVGCSNAHVSDTWAGKRNADTPKGRDIAKATTLMYKKLAEIEKDILKKIGK